MAAERRNGQTVTDIGALTRKATRKAMAHLNGVMETDTWANS